MKLRKLIEAETITKHLDQILAQFAGGTHSYKIIRDHGVDCSGMERQKTKKMTAKQCFANAAHLAIEKGYTYVEGYATTHKINFPLEHAWCVTKDGKLVDPTWEDGAEYFGVPFKMDYLLEVMHETGQYGVFSNWKCRKIYNDDPENYVEKLGG